MSKINIHRNTFLEKEELVRMIGFFNDRDDVNAILSLSKAYGLVSPNAEPGKPFLVTASELTIGAINVAGGSMITPDNKAWRMDDVSDFNIPNDNTYYWLKASPDERNYETGTVSIDKTGQVTGTVMFTGVVRGQASGVPTCVRFVKTDGTTLQNDKVYQVVDIINDNTILLSGGQVFKPEQNLRVIVLGSIPLGRRFTDDQLEGLYTFTSISLSLVAEDPDNPEMPPMKDENEYYLVRIKNNNGVLIYSDVREDFWSLGGTGGGGDPTVKAYENFESKHMTEANTWENFTSPEEEGGTSYEIVQVVNPEAPTPTPDDEEGETIEQQL